MDGTANTSPRSLLRGAADLWPGLARLWWAGDIVGLMYAIAFAVLSNFLLLGRVWPDWISPSVQRSLAGGLVLLVGWGVWDARLFRISWQRARLSDEHLDLFLSARREYLRGQRENAERLLQQLLQAKPDDIESRLLLVTLLRRAHRVDEAKEQLRRLQRWRDAGKWNLEIRREWEHLGQLAAVVSPVVKSPRRWDFRAAGSRVSTSSEVAEESCSNSSEVAQEIVELAAYGQSALKEPNEKQSVDELQKAEQRPLREAG
ncbi:MAG: tetratricopeptide repeat protein [Planctomycetales bacterium]|nr:tetratricopeptide repeat protein [Planctomycetales bacterium]